MARRSFTAEYKKKILDEIEATPANQKEILKREGLQSAHLIAFKRAVSGEETVKTFGDLGAVFNHLDRIEAILGSLTGVVNSLTEKLSEPSLQILEMQKQLDKLVQGKK